MVGGSFGGLSKICRLPRRLLPSASGPPDQRERRGRVGERGARDRMRKGKRKRLESDCQVSHPAVLFVSGRPAGIFYSVPRDGLASPGSPSRSRYFFRDFPFPADTLASVILDAKTLSVVASGIFDTEVGRADVVRCHVR